MTMAGFSIVPPHYYYTLQDHGGGDSTTGFRVEVDGCVWVGAWKVYAPPSRVRVESIGSADHLGRGHAWAA